MRITKYIEKVLSSFNLLTDIPIQAFDYNGEKIAESGISEYYLNEFENNNIYDQLINFMYQNNDDTVSNSDDIHYTITQICPRNKYRGNFIIGPYTSNKKIRHIKYKPLSIKPYMISTIRTIWRSSPMIDQIEDNEDPYSFHVKKAVDYIDAKYMYDLKLDDLAEHLDINKSYFCSLFKNETNHTFTQYLNKVRVDKSKKLLKSKNQSVLDIALSVGFNNQNYYNIVFKKLTNKTPLEYRNKNIA